jgi:hypothetical protein
MLLDMASGLKAWGFLIFSKYFISSVADFNLSIAP